VQFFQFPGSAASISYQDITRPRNALARKNIAHKRSGVHLTTRAKYLNASPTGRLPRTPTLWACLPNHIPLDNESTQTAEDEGHVSGLKASSKTLFNSCPFCGRLTRGPFYPCNPSRSRFSFMMAFLQSLVTTPLQHLRTMMHLQHLITMLSIDSFLYKFAWVYKGAGSPFHLHQAIPILPLQVNILQTRQYELLEPQWQESNSF